MSNYTSEAFFKTCSELQLIDLYNNQYDEEQHIASIDKINEGCDLVYKIYCYHNDPGKYLCRVFEIEV